MYCLLFYMGVKIGLSLYLRDENKLWVSENRVLSKIFWRREKVQMLAYQCDKVKEGVWRRHVASVQKR
jgi:hypothetical protein